LISLSAELCDIEVVDGLAGFDARSAALPGLCGWSSRGGRGCSHTAVQGVVAPGSQPDGWADPAGGGGP
jgi:hypothetical protein